MRMIKNREIFLVQNATRPFLKHIYRSLRALLNSTLTRNEFGSFQTQTIHKIEVSKPCIYTFYTKIKQIPYCSILESIASIQKTLDFHTCDLLFLSFFLLFSSSSSLLFSLLFPFPFLMDHPQSYFQRRKLPPPFLHATCPFLDFSSFSFFFNIFLLLLFGPQFHFYSQFNLSKILLWHMNLLSYDPWVLNW